MTYKLSKPTGYQPGQPQARVLIVRGNAQINPAPGWNRRGGPEFVPVPGAIISVQLDGKQGTALFLTPEEAEEVATALQFYARGLHITPTLKEL